MKTNYHAVEGRLDDIMYTLSIMGYTRMIDPDGKFSFEVANMCKFCKLVQNKFIDKQKGKLSTHDAPRCTCTMSTAYVICTDAHGWHAWHTWHVDMGNHGVSGMQCLGRPPDNSWMCGFRQVIRGSMIRRRRCVTVGRGLRGKGRRRPPPGTERGPSSPGPRPKASSKSGV